MPDSVRYWRRCRHRESFDAASLRKSNPKEKRTSNVLYGKSEGKVVERKQLNARGETSGDTGAKSEAGCFVP